MHPDVIALVPARAGSKGLPGKNIKDLCGKPLYRHSVDAALDAGIPKVFISTDIDEVFSHALPDCVSVVRRPPELAGDETTMADVLLEFLDSTLPAGGTIVLLQPTSPLRKSHHIQAGLTLFSGGDCSLAMSVCPANRGVLKWGQIHGDRFQTLSDPRYCFANRQSLPPVFRPNGALYVFDADTFRAKGDFSAASIKVVQMSEEESLDVDTLDDFRKCEAAISQGTPQ
ncbi:acylneuraminate cytidylyltransferase family protein [Sinorhizobium fredii]|uniref:acylneuraminate cytidylyltransferase family protein n=1 Tax=Rhizobium fredii TaxID=380 RepID=UPI0005956F70|nr:acylneuraminate cytidylyltransferase family protein [Sinorhizobium fredii]WOS65239.1 acylneuraminate cytidylyltransferase family protein [Sinorhizobium fredii GR64]